MNNASSPSTCVRSARSAVIERRRYRWQACGAAVADTVKPQVRRMTGMAAAHVVEEEGRRERRREGGGGGGASVRCRARGGVSVHETRAGDIQAKRWMESMEVAPQRYATKPSKRGRRKCQPLKRRWRAGRRQAYSCRCVECCRRVVCRDENTTWHRRAPAASLCLAAFSAARQARGEVMMEAWEARHRRRR